MRCSEPGHSCGFIRHPPLGHVAELGSLGRYAHVMKGRTETLGRDASRPWLMMLALSFAVVVIYIFGALASRVLYARGILRDGSGTLDFLDTAFTPVHSIYSHSPAFKAGFDWCAGIIIPKQKKATR